MSAVIDVGEGEGGARARGAARIAGRTNKNGNYCNLDAVGGQLGGPAPFSSLHPYLISEATAKLSSQEVHFFNLYLRRLI